jgi:hypothetical protein
MGLDANTTAAARRALSAEREASWSETLPPVLVVRSAAVPERFPLSLPRPAGRLRPGAPQVALTMPGGRQPARRGLRARRNRAARLRTWPAAPGTGSGSAARPPVGYHELQLTARYDSQAQRGATTMIVCPDRSFEAPEEAGGRRAAGLGVALYGLRSARNAGSGTGTCAG